MAAVRSLLRTSAPTWSTNWTFASPSIGASSVEFIVMHDRSIDVILNDQRGEGFVKQVFSAVLTDQCLTNPPATVIDIGANTGYYSMLSAAHGCAVVAIDAQPGCSKWFEAARSANEANSSHGSMRFAPSSVKMVNRPVRKGNAKIDMDMYSCWVMHKSDVRVHSKRPIAGRVAVEPLGVQELTTLVASSRPIVLAKVDVEGAELDVLEALHPLLPRISNLEVELAPGWWPLYAKRSSEDRAAARMAASAARKAGRGAWGSGGWSKGVGRPAGGSAPQDKLVHIVGSGSGGSNRVTMLASEVARIRQAGATQLSRLLRPLAKGGGGFALALASNGKLFAREERLHEFLLRMGSNGYWDQLDMWFARNGTTVRRARRLICLRRQTHKSQRAALQLCGE